MEYIIPPLAFGYVVLLCFSNFFEWKTAIIAGIATALAFLAYPLFHLPDAYLVVLIVLIAIILIASLIKLKLKK